VPCLLLAWGSETFGLWLLVSTMPGYLALADFGFSVTSANEMTMAAARSAYDEAIRIFQSVMALNCLVAFGLSAIVLLLTLVLPDALFPYTASVTVETVKAILLLLTVHVLAIMCSEALFGAFQSSGHYSLSVFLASTARFLEASALLGTAVLTRSVLPAMAAMLVVRLFAILCTGLILKRVAPWVKYGFSHSSSREIRRLTKPAIAVMVLPAAFAISLQGQVLVIGYTLSLNAVAIFSSVRTLTRAVIQATAIVNHAIMPEVTRAVASEDRSRLKRLLELNLASVCTINLATFVVVITLGEWLISLWTQGRITVDWKLLVGLAGVAALHSLWLSYSNLILAVNKPGWYSYWFLGASLASTACSIPFTRYLGLEGILWPLLAGEVMMIVVVARAFRSVYRLPISRQEGPSGATLVDRRTGDREL
jgi:O-antigen/teichoic acid export membrane protein